MFVYLVMRWFVLFGDCVLSGLGVGGLFGVGGGGGFGIVEVLFLRFGLMVLVGVFVLFVIFWI